jgi:gamma-glutamyltranspeptidase / glutathione hydrolase
LPSRTRSALLAALVVLTGCYNSPAAAPLPSAGAVSFVNPAWPYAGKAKVAEAPKAMVVSGNQLASQAGRDILQAGGNAVDAAVAVGFALAVTHPEAGNIGGGGFMVFRFKDGTTAAIDYREMAPGKASPDMYLNSDRNPNSTLSDMGALASGVPGAVAGMLEAHRKYGKLPLAQVMAPAIALARDGFIVDEYRHRSIEGNRGGLYLFPGSRRYFLTDSGFHAPAVGSRWKQTDLGRTLQEISDKGRDGFYKGWVADSLVAEMERGGGLISLEDLANYKAEWREPIAIKYRDHTIYSMPPASSGGVTLALILNIMEGYGPLPQFGSPALLHREAEAMRRAFTDRNIYLGDPAFVKMPLERLLSKEYAATLRNQIQLGKATPTPPFDPSIRDGNSTTHYSVVDAEGNAVSTTTTLNDSYGSSVAVSGAGFLLNDEMDDFTVAPGKPNGYGLVQGEANAIKPGKRMLSAMTPSIVLDPQGQLLMVVGTPGGPTIITQVYHVISNVIDHKMGLADAVASPRMHHQALPDQVRLEREGFLPATVQSLESLGHKVSVSGRWGDVEAIIRTPSGWQGVSDPRLGGGGAGY